MAQSKNGKIDRLDEAMISLLQAQAALVQNQALFNQALIQSQAQQEAWRRQVDERFARIEKILLEHSRILMEHSQILSALPEAIGKQFGFRRPEPQGTAS